MLGGRRELCLEELVAHQGDRGRWRWWTGRKGPQCGSSKSADVSGRQFAKCLWSLSKFLVFQLVILRTYRIKSWSSVQDKARGIRRLITRLFIKTRKIGSKPSTIGVS